MKKLLYLASLILVISFVSCDPIEYNMFGNIEGTVLDYDTNEPLEYVSVQLSPGGKNCSTSADGSFTFSDLDAKQYTITVQKSGYETNMKTANVLASETTSVMITMKKIDY